MISGGRRSSAIEPDRDCHTMFPFTFNFPVPDIVNPFASRPYSRSPSPPVLVSRKRQRSFDTDAPPSDHEVDTTPGKQACGLHVCSGIIPQWLSIILIMHLSLSSLFALFRAGTINLTDLRSRLSLFKVELPPPAKRRRGFAGSIVSTALNAALLGSAVGLTVYRL